MARTITLAATLFLFAAVGKADSLAPPAPDEVVLPSDTDPEIQTFNNPQAIYFPKSRARGKLFVLLTGTNGKKPFAHRLCAMAARLGYPVIEPMYPDDVAAESNGSPKFAAVWQYMLTAPTPTEANAEEAPK